MRIRPILTIVIIGLLSPLAGRAVVYSLKPGLGPEAVDELLKPRHVLQEKVLINGAKGTLRAGITELSLKQVLAALSEVLANYKHRGNQGAVLIDVPGKSNLIRYCILSMGPKLKTLVFRLEIPKAGLKDAASRFWPRGLPAPQGGKIELVMKLSKSKGIYATFNAAADAGQVFHDYDFMLRNSGWRHIAGDRVRGGVYLNKQRKQILTFSTIAGETQSHGAIYVRPTGK